MPFLAGESPGKLTWLDERETVVNVLGENRAVGSSLGVVHLKFVDDVLHLRAVSEGSGMQVQRPSAREGKINQVV